MVGNFPYQHLYNIKNTKHIVINNAKKSIKDFQKDYKKILS